MMAAGTLALWVAGAIRLQAVRRAGYAVPGLVRPPRGAVALGVAAGAGSFLFAMLNVAVLYVIYRGNIPPRPDLEKVLGLEGIPFAVAALLVSFGAPFAEEFFFRGAIFGPFLEARQLKRAFLVSGLLFAIAHFYMPMFAHYLVSGMAFAWVYAETGTLWAPIAAHATLNCTATLMLVASRLMGWRMPGT
ncbi:MAG: CPBP family intramembrane metalloprotease [Acidobacteria bacterium]|nr:CPBP family intramembrane metalloprotease [Acidobacteriota bacterium]